MISCGIFFISFYAGCFLGVSRVFPGCFPGVSRVLPGTIFSLLLCQKSPQLLLKKFFFSKLAPFILKHTSLTQNVSKCTFPGCFPGVSWVFPGCFPGVSRVFPGCFPGVPGLKFFVLFYFVKNPHNFC